MEQKKSITLHVLDVLPNFEWFGRLTSNKECPNIHCKKILLYFFPNMVPLLTRKAIAPLSTLLKLS